MFKKILSLLVMVIALNYVDVSAQDDMALRISLIDSTLLKDANAVIRSEEVVVEINAVNSITTKTKKIITVLNKYGDRHAAPFEGYDRSTKIKKINAVFFDALGEEVKKYKKGDFIDQSMISSGELFDDTRILYINHTPLGYPYTLVFESEVESSTTAFVRHWEPISDNYISIQESKYTISNPKQISVKVKESNFKNYSIDIERNAENISYSVSNLAAIPYEALSPSGHNIYPMVKPRLTNFMLEGVKGTAENWELFGKWMHQELLQGRDQLPRETIDKVGELVAGVSSKKEKAKLIYEYVQDKTRYISVQLGIGGWMPFLASDVDRLGYGDCKALTNYTKALLDSQGILSYYTVVFANERRDIDPEFTSMQGNHVILNIPGEKEDIWLECTSQVAPFNFIGDFTDDRNVLIVKPEGGEIKKTKRYEPEENTLHAKATIDLGVDTSMKATIHRVSRGLEYDWNYGIQFEAPKDQKVYYKEYWRYVNDLEINSLQLNDNKNTVEFTEELKVSSSNYSKKVGSRLLVAPNVFSCDQSNLPKYENRNTPLEISKGYVHTDVYEIKLPSGYILNKVLEKKIIETEFGKYSYELQKIDESTIKLKRYLKIIDGTFPKEKYEEYRKFRSAIKKHDKSKIVLKQS